MDLSRGYAEAFPEPEARVPLPGAHAAPPGQRPPTAVGYSSGDEYEHGRRRFFRRWRRERPARGGVAVLSEFTRVDWPKRDDVLYIVAAVIVITLLFGALLGAIDIGLGWLVERALLR